MKKKKLHVSFLVKRLYTHVAIKLFRKVRKGYNE